LPRFVVDGQWLCSEAHALTKDHSCTEQQNNIVHVLPSTRFAPFICIAFELTS
jgi:hypothetical protein